MKIAILGAGAFGTALGGILADNGYGVDYYDRYLENKTLSSVLNGANMMLLCVPSMVIRHLLPYLPKDIPLIVATKGILKDKVFEDFKDYMVMSGPGFASEIKAAKETKLTITDNRLRDLFKADYMVFDQTDDKKGVLMCGSLKNVYAIEAGIRGLKRDSLEWKKFVTDAAEEMKKILAKNGARGSTVNLACGIGDLGLTCGYPSRNYEYGDLLRQDPKYKAKKTVEGLETLRRIKRGDIIVPDSAIIMRSLMEKMK